MKKSKPARVRFAPSPTGHTHLGSGRTALYNYLLARQTGGQFIFRIEDTDQKRYMPEAEAELIDSLRWLGLDWDEGPDVGGPYGPYRQSERKEIYQKHARQLIENGYAYYCFCSPERLKDVRRERQLKQMAQSYDGFCRNITLAEADDRISAGEKPVVRFKMPREGSITMTDALRGDITVENRVLDDYILVKSDGLALYHLAVVVDDHLMKITHVFRTSEWLPTFPLHAHITRAFGWDEPVWAHPSIFLKPSGKGKMSKRDATRAVKDGHSIFVKDLEKLGYVPEAVVNWVALMGWSYDDHTEFFTMLDLIEKFSIESLNPAPAAINYSKLDHFNGLHIRNLPVADLAQRIAPHFEASGFTVDADMLLKIAPIVQVRLVTLDDAPRMAGFFFKDEVDPDPEALIGKKMNAAESAVVARRAYQVLAELPEFRPEATEPPMRALVEELGLKAGQVFGVLRVAVTGQTVSPPLFESMEIIGKVKVLERTQKAIEILDEIASQENGEIL